jgi:hypothetical protein
MKQNSLIHPKYEFNEKMWVVSLINKAINQEEDVIKFLKQETSKLLGGHAKIVIEGFKDEQLYIAECHAMECKDENQQDQKGYFDGTMLQFLSNTQCYIQPLFKDYQGKYPDGRESQYKYADHKSWLLPKEEAEKVIAKTKQKITKFENGHPKKFQYGGAYRLGIFGGNGGDNCTTFAMKLLKAGGVELPIRPLDLVKAAPSKHTDKNTNEETNQKTDWCSIS